eukprot:6203333-Pleurochrysis_carterae.AAC.6
MKACIHASVRPSSKAGAFADPSSWAFAAASAAAAICASDIIHGTIAGAAVDCSCFGPPYLEPPRMLPPCSAEAEEVLHAFVEAPADLLKRMLFAVSASLVCSVTCQ